MKIEVLKLIEDALIGGRNGEMAYIENNPLIMQIYRDWQHENENNRSFIKFIKDCLLQDDKKEDNQAYRYKSMNKSYEISSNDVLLKTIQKLDNEISSLNNQKNKALKELAESKNKMLSDISTYKIDYREYGTSIKFTFSVEQVLEKIEDK